MNCLVQQWPDNSKDPIDWNVDGQRYRTNNVVER